jgi:hypothetical protein
MAHRRRLGSTELRFYTARERACRVQVKAFQNGLQRSYGVVASRRRGAGESPSSPSCLCAPDFNGAAASHRSRTVASTCAFLSMASARFNRAAVSHRREEQIERGSAEQKRKEASTECGFTPQGRRLADLAVQGDRLLGGASKELRLHTAGEVDDRSQRGLC